MSIHHGGLDKLLDCSLDSSFFFGAKGYGSTHVVGIEVARGKKSLILLQRGGKALQHLKRQEIEIFRNDRVLERCECVADVRWRKVSKV